MDAIPTDNPHLLQQLEKEVHVWLTRPDDVTDPGLLQAYRSLLSTDERARYERFHFDTDRHHYLVSHALLRKALSAYVDVEPPAWQFSRNQYGRPDISGPGIAPDLRFNLSHTTGLVACVVALDQDCGIDVERVSARGNLPGIAGKMFADSEQRVLKGLDGQAFLDRFFCYWTLREAYCKALGVGIANSKRNYCFVEQGSGQWAIRFDAASDAGNQHWQFAVMKPVTGHLLAVAVRAADVKDRQIIRKFVLP